MRLRRLFSDFSRLSHNFETSETFWDFYWHFLGGKSIFSRVSGSCSDSEKVSEVWMVCSRGQKKSLKSYISCDPTLERSCHACATLLHLSTFRSYKESLLVCPSQGLCLRPIQYYWTEDGSKDCRTLAGHVDAAPILGRTETCLGHVDHQLDSAFHS